jgi:hypothetical protein
MKTLILYCTHIINESLLYFINRGIIENNDYYYYFIFNNPAITPPETLLNKKNINIIVRNNIGYDFGGWSHVLLTNINGKPMYLDYDYFILLNGTCTGPILPLYCINTDWVEVFCKNITDEVKLFGPTINIWKNLKHVQSYFLCTDKIGIKIGIDNNIIRHNNIIVKNGADKWKIVHDFEIKYSQVIMKNGYIIGHLPDGRHPIEVIFYKYDKHAPQHNSFVQSYKNSF